MALTLNQITNALGISRSRVDQWISRGQFLTGPNYPLRRQREWLFQDAVRLALMNRLLAQSVDAETAGRLTQSNIHPVGEGVTFFVAWSGLDGALHRDIVDGSRLGDFLTASEDELARFRGDQFLAGSGIEFAIVVNVDALARDVREALEIEAGRTEARRTEAGPADAD